MITVLKNVFFSLGFSVYSELIFKIILFCLVSAGLIWLIDFILVKAFSKTSMHRDVYLLLQFLISLMIFFIIFSIYFFFFIKYVGLHQFHWTDSRFYLELLPQLLVYLGSIILFLIKYAKYRNIINN